MELLHRLPSADIQDVPISAHSTWSSDTWRFPDTTAGAPNAVLHWGRQLPDGSCLMDAQWTGFLDLAKRLVWSLRTEPASGRPMKVGTLNAWTVGFWALVGWMSVAGYRNPRELDAIAIDEYVEHLRATKAGGDDGVSGQMVLRYLTPLANLWQQADILAEAGVRSLPQDPFRGKSTAAVAREISEFSEGEIPTVDDDTFVATVNELAHWLDFKGRDVVRLMEIVVDLQQTRTRPKNGWVRQGDRRSLQPRLREFAFSIDPHTGQPWHPPLNECENLSATCRSLMLALNLAGVIVLQSLVGMRISEVRGLEVEAIGHDGLPSCIEVESSASGLFDVFFIKGRLFKTTSEWVATRWVAGMRTKGTDYLPPPVQAVVLVERLFRAWREAGAPKTLFMSVVATNGMPTGTAKFRPLTGSGAQLVDQHEWVERHVGVSPPIRLTSHQWRKAFAKHIFRTDKRLLPALALHLKHVSLAMTERYVGNDLELIEDIDSEASRHAADRLYEWASGAKPARGATAKLIMERCSSIGKRLGNYDEAERRREIEHIVDENGIRVWPLRHGDRAYGDCVFRPGVAFCRSVPVGPMPRPDSASATLGLCSRCTSFTVDEIHAAYWRDRLDRNLSLLAECDPEDIGLVTLTQQRIDQCRRVLAWFEEPAREAVDVA